MDTLTITKPQREAALLRGEQVAAESAAHLWAELCDRIDTICGERIQTWN